MCVKMRVAEEWGVILVECATTAVDPLHLVNSPPSESAFSPSSSNFDPFTKFEFSVLSSPMTDQELE